MPARRDVARTATIGAATVLLAGCVIAPRADESIAATPQATASASASAAAASAVPNASADATAAPTALSDPAVLGLEATTCPGGVVLEWTPSTHANFHHYTALRSLDEEIAPDYPPIAPAVDWGETYATDPFITSAVDGSILPSNFDWHYRVMAYDILNDVVSASPVREAHITERQRLGEPRVESVGESTEIAWQPFEGPAGCFSAYRVLFGVGYPPSTVLSQVSNPDLTQIVTEALHSGITYQLRIDALRVTPLGNLVVGRSETVFYTVP